MPKFEDARLLANAVNSSAEYLYCGIESLSHDVQKNESARYFWNRVDDLRDGKPLKDLANNCQVDYVLFLNWRTKHRLPDLMSACYLAQELGTCAEYLALGHVSTEATPLMDIYQKGRDMKGTDVRLWERLDLLAAAKDSTLKAICREHGIVYGTIMSCKSRDNLPNLEVTIQLAKALGVSLDRLALGKEHENAMVAVLEANPSLSRMVLRLVKCTEAQMRIVNGLVDSWLMDDREK